MAIRINGDNTTAAPGITSNADTDTGIQFGSDEISLVTGGTEQVKVDSSGRLLVNTSTARSQQSVIPELQVENTTWDGISLIVNGGTTASKAPVILMGRSAGTTNGSSTLVSPDQRLGAILFQGADGTDIETCAAIIECNVDGTPSANVMPGRFTFSTTTTGGSLKERLVLNSDGFFDFSGNGNNAGQIYGGFGGWSTTSGVTNDFNHADNARSGCGKWLLTGSASNGPGGSSYFHIFNFEYSAKNSTGNLTQIAWGYNDATLRYMRYRYVGTWSSWSAF